MTNTLAADIPYLPESWTTQQLDAHRANTMEEALTLMARLYSVHTRTYGVILKTDDSIAAARAWAKTALGADVICVTPPAAKPCDWCGSTPSLCGCRQFRNRHED